MNMNEKIKTNADRIRAMSDKELTKFYVAHSLLCERCFFKRRCSKDPTGVCYECARNWLRAPVEEGGT